MMRKRTILFLALIHISQDIGIRTQSGITDKALRNWATVDTGIHIQEVAVIRLTITIIREAVTDILLPAIPVTVRTIRHLQFTFIAKVLAKNINVFVIIINSNIITNYLFLILL